MRDAATNGRKASAKQAGVWLLAFVLAATPMTVAVAALVVGVHLDSVLPVVCIALAFVAGVVWEALR